MITVEDFSIIERLIDIAIEREQVRTQRISGSISVTDYHRRTHKLDEEVNTYRQTLTLLASPGDGANGGSQ